MQSFKKLKARLSGHPTSRPHTPMSTGSNHELDPSDDSPGGSISITPATGTQAGAPDIKDDKKQVPTTSIGEILTSLAPASTHSKKFPEVKTKDAQHDVVVLHVSGSIW
jgi:hypothetical protein